MSNSFSEEILETLRKNRADLSKMRRFDFYLYVPTESYAVMISEKVRKSGFDAKVSRSGKKWSIVVSRALVPATANFADHQRFFQQLAEAAGGEFDGWETILEN